MNESDPISTKIYKANEVIMEQGEKGNFVYLIISGSVNIYKTDKDNQQLIATMTSGDILGEMGILTNEPRNATAIAVEDSKVVMIRDHTLHSALLNDKLPIIKPLTKQLVLRCREIEQANTDNMIKIEKLEAEVALLKAQQLEHSLSQDNPPDK